MLLWSPTSSVSCSALTDQEMVCCMEVTPSLAVISVA